METAQTILISARKVTGLSQRKFAALLKKEGLAVSRDMLANYETRTPVPSAILLASQDILAKARKHRCKRNA